MSCSACGAPWSARPGLHAAHPGRHDLGCVAREEMPGPSHAHELTSRDRRRDAGRHRRWDDDVPGPGDDDRGHTHRAQRGLHGTDLADEGALLGHEAPPHLPPALGGDLVVALVGQRGPQPFQRTETLGPDQVTHERQHMTQGEEPGRAEGLSHDRGGEKSVEDIQAVGVTDGSHQDESRHELGPACRELDADPSAVAVADDGDRRGVALHHQVSQHLGIALDAERLVTTAAIARTVHDEQPMIGQPLRDLVPVAPEAGLSMDQEDRGAPAAVNDERRAQDSRPRRSGPRRSVGRHRRHCRPRRPRRANAAPRSRDPTSGSRR